MYAKWRVHVRRAATTFNVDFLGQREKKNRDADEHSEYHCFHSNECCWRCAAHIFPLLSSHWHRNQHEDVAMPATVAMATTTMLAFIGPRVLRTFTYLLVLLPTADAATFDNSVVSHPIDAHQKMDRNQIATRFYRSNCSSASLH